MTTENCSYLIVERVPRVTQPKNCCSTAGHFEATRALHEYAKAKLVECGGEVKKGEVLEHMDLAKLVSGVYIRKVNSTSKESKLEIVRHSVGWLFPTTDEVLCSYEIEAVPVYNPDSKCRVSAVAPARFKAGDSDTEETKIRDELHEQIFKKTESIKHRNENTIYSSVLGEIMPKEDATDGINLLHNQLVAAVTKMEKKRDRIL